MYSSISKNKRWWVSVPQEVMSRNHWCMCPSIQVSPALRGLVAAGLGWAELGTQWWEQIRSQPSTASILLCALAACFFHSLKFQTRRGRRYLISFYLVSVQSETQSPHLDHTTLPKPPLASPVPFPHLLPSWGSMMASVILSQLLTGFHADILSMCLWPLLFLPGSLLSSCTGFLAVLKHIGLPRA